MKTLSGIINGNLHLTDDTRISGIVNGDIVADGCIVELSGIINGKTDSVNGGSFIDNAGIVNGKLKVPAGAGTKQTSRSTFTSTNSRAQVATLGHTFELRDKQLYIDGVFVDIKPKRFAGGGVSSNTVNDKADISMGGYKIKVSPGKITVNGKSI